MFGSNSKSENILLQERYKDIHTMLPAKISVTKTSSLLLKICLILLQFMHFLNLYNYREPRVPVSYFVFLELALEFLEFNVV